jgi:hypothetical protein
MAPIIWTSKIDDDRLVTELLRAIEEPVPVESGATQTPHPAGGAMDVASPLYVVRSDDYRFREALLRQDSIVLIKGGRQTGKTSLLARGLQYARLHGRRVVLTDVQKIGEDDLQSVDRLFQAFTRAFVRQLGLDADRAAAWNPALSAGENFETFLRAEVLNTLSEPLVWGVDEIDRLLGLPYSSGVFALFRSWHNERALDPSGPWRNFSVAIAYATEAHLFISDLSLSPFNVGARMTLEDFTVDEVADLNERFGSPLRSRAEVDTVYDLLRGHPYLTSRCLEHLVSARTRIGDLSADADLDDGLFGDHLRRLFVAVSRDSQLVEEIRSLLDGRPCSELSRFFRLRTGGLVIGPSPDRAKIRCKLYERFFRRTLT